MKNCTRCTTAHPDEANYCMTCGTKFERPEREPSTHGRESNKILHDVKLILVAGSTFEMGSHETEPGRRANELRHRVSVDDFYLSEKTITNEQYCIFLNEKNIFGNGQLYVLDYGNKTLVAAYRMGVEYTNRIWRPSPGMANHPVAGVSWYGAKAYCDWLGARLPTEAEWEYACRAGSDTPFNTGGNLTTLQANYNGARPYDGNAAGINLKQTQPVGTYEPNAWGFYEMHGNIKEWCYDRYGNYESDEQINPVGPAIGQYRVLRGGDWGCCAAYCRSASRGYGNPDVSNYTIGFRVAAEVSSSGGAE